ncbi:hypothetical protein GCM10027456_14640 [Kineosporia babensis]
MPRSGTSWVGKMLQLSGEVVYVNEPMNPSRPPGRSPGVLNADVEHYFHYIPGSDQARWRAAFARTLSLRYSLLPELRRNRSAGDLMRAAKYCTEFGRGRLTGRTALLDDPYASVSAGWLASEFDATVVVLVRDPVTLVASWQKLGWVVDPAELLNQPALMADHLEPERERLSRAARSGDPVEQIIAVWRAVYLAVLGQADAGRVLLRRYEDLAAQPVPAFENLYRDCGLTYDQATRAAVQQATGADTGNSGAFQWSGLSRTAFRPMDSAAKLREPVGLPDSVVDQVRSGTEDVLGRLSR